MNVFLLILWIVIGAINIGTAVVNGGTVDIISYICCWVLLLVYLLRECFNN